MTKKIIVAPLNWGLGHAARCVPIIHFLLENNFIPIIASDGLALCFLQKEFPNFETLELPSYNVLYTKKLKLGLVLQSPKILKAIRAEKKVIDDFIEVNKDVVGVISDNRFGVRNTRVKSVYITHQLNVLSDFTTFFTSYLHQKIIQKFDECWIPDFENSEFSGKLSITKNSKIKKKFIGILSRFQKEEIQKENDVLIILSGIESQRKSLEKKLLVAFKNYSKKVVLVQGKIENNQTVKVENGIKIYNYLLSSELEQEINQSEIVICRSGYSSIMDLAVLRKKVFFIPTKNQTEQEYLASYLETKAIAPFCEEENFNLDCLDEVKYFNGVSVKESKLDKDLLSLF